MSRIAKAIAIFGGLVALQATSWLGIGPLARTRVARPSADLPGVITAAFGKPAAGVRLETATSRTAAADRASRSERTATLRSLGTFKITCYVLRGTTKSGRPAGPAVVAVDPKVIRLGSWLVVDGFGRRLAADTGRLVRGRHIDVWMSSYDRCIDFGVRHRTVWVEKS